MEPESEPEPEPESEPRPGPDPRPDPPPGPGPGPEFDRERARVSRLVLQVFGAVLHPEWFATRAHLRVARPGWRADIRLVPGGHVVVWTADATNLHYPTSSSVDPSGAATPAPAAPVGLTEVLADLDLELPVIPPLFRAGVRRARAAVLRPAPGVRHQINVECERLAAARFQLLREEIEADAEFDRDAARPTLHHREPGPSRLALGPIALVRHEIVPRGLSVHAIHAHPASRAVVRTQSLFEILPPPPGGNRR